MLWFLRLALPWMIPRLGRDSDAIRDLMLECFSLRQQNAVLLRQGRRARLAIPDRAFWVLLRRIWPRWESACLVVKPATVIRWHRAGFRLFWALKSRKPSGRRTRKDLIALIRKMASENPTWGAPRVHGEMLKLGLHVSERTVSRFMPKRGYKGDDLIKRRQTWKTFLENHREVIAAMDFLVVPTWDFRPLHVLVILDHGRRMVRHLNVTAHPTTEWMKQQIREAFPFDEKPRYLIHDRDTIFRPLKEFLVTFGIEIKLTAYHAPWQNGFVERMHGSIRKDLLDHIIPLDENHLRRLLKDYLRYYHEDRTHLGLNKDSPGGRPVDEMPWEDAMVKALPRCGGLHHRYIWQQAA